MFKKTLLEAGSHGVKRCLCHPADGEVKHTSFLGGNLVPFTLLLGLYSKGGGSLEVQTKSFLEGSLAYFGGKTMSAWSQHRC